MSHYLFVQSQDPFTEVATQSQFALAGNLAKAGHKVTVFLIQNGVTVARRGAVSESLDALPETGVTLIADGLSLDQREINPGHIRDGLGRADVDVVIDAMLAGHKVIWN